ncbi:unnamed protein product [Heligmosomoides polygyrus]|uniref:Sm domain-containing protein n=1 Tax=Heligmosomoides polygyrus TaxID=6339 RepID=A0A3P7YMG7_HELPZ|nr:unnamed protein product [Heligmosomoides polygyrus]
MQPTDDQVLPSAMCDDPFSEEFDATAALDHSPDGGVDDVHGSIEDFERALVAEQPEVARMICELDRPPGMKSKKQEKRDRVARLEEMTIAGRKLFEAKVPPVERLDALEALHSQCSSGPMALLYRAVKEGQKVEVHLRALNRVDRIARGYLLAFDRHMNAVLRDVDEVALPGRKEERLYGRRRLQELHLPFGMRWHEGGEWPRPLGASRRVLSRHLPTTMIKGDTVVLFRLLS